MSAQSTARLLPSAEGDASADGELLRAASRGDRRAFAELVGRYYRPVYRFAWRMTGGHADTDDIAQEAFLKLWSNPGQVREAGALKGWLMRVASNLAIDRTRRKPHDDIDSLPELPDGGEGADRLIERQSAARKVDMAIAALPERQKQALILVYYEGMTNIEAAAAMEVSVEAVESLLARARRALKQGLAGEWRELLDGAGKVT